MTSITFTIPGKPRGQGRPRATAIGKSARVYKAKNDRLYESRVQEAFYAAVAASGEEWKPLKGPVLLWVTAVYAPPSSMKKAHRAWFQEHVDWLLRLQPVHRTQRPDLSNVVKAVEDGLQGLGFLDDKQIIFISACKQYGSDSYVEVTIEELNK